MLLVRQSIKGASQSFRLALAFRAISPTWANVTSSSSLAGRAHGSRGFPGTTKGPLVPQAAPLEARKEDPESRPRNTEASLVDQSPAAPGSQRRPGPSRATLQEYAPAVRGQQTGSWSRPQISPGTKQYFRFVRIFGLSADMTLADILEGIAQTAPVGRVLHIEWEKRGERNYRGRQVKSAQVLFDHDAAAADLVRLAKQHSFLVRGESAHVDIWARRAFHSNADKELAASRVVHIRGRRDVESFSEEGIRRLVMENDRFVKALGPLGLDAEAVVTTEEGGGKLIEWRFFSNERQAKPVIMILRRVFYKLLVIEPGPDPCWNRNLYPRSRTGNKDARLLRPPGKAFGNFEWPSVHGQGLVSSEKDFHRSLQKVFTEPGGDGDQMPWKRPRESREDDSQIFEKLYGGHSSPQPLNTRQHERVSAWTQIDQSSLSKTGSQYDQKDDDHQKARKPKPFDQKQRKQLLVRPGEEVLQGKEDKFGRAFSKFSAERFPKQKGKDLSAFWQAEQNERWPTHRNTDLVDEKKKE